MTISFLCGGCAPWIWQGLFMPDQMQPADAPTNRVTVRSATPGDHGPIVAVLDDWWGGRGMADMLPRLFLDHFGSTSLVAVGDDDALAGFLIGFLSPDQPGTAYIHFAGVSPAHRRQGLATDLYRRFFSMASERGAVRAKAVTAVANVESQAFHRAIGFSISEPIDAYDRVGADRVVMTRELTEGSPADAIDAWPDPPRFLTRPDPRPQDPPWPEAIWPPPPDVVLRGTFVELRQARATDAPGLFEALDDARVWAHVRGRPNSPASWREMLVGAEAMGRFPWTVRLRSAEGGLAEDAVAGTSSFLSISPLDARLEIGWTVYAPSVWGSVVNPEVKLLLLAYAFDELQMGRVELRTDIRNARSQQAIARLGATYEGTLRRYQRRENGSVRDTVLFSILAKQWPTVRARLERRIEGFHSDA